MPRAIELDREYGPKGLVVILVEVQGTPAEELPAFLLRNFGDTRTRVAPGGAVPIAASGNGIPRSALIGVDGTLLIEGYTGAIGQKIDRLIAAEVAKVQRGWGNDPEIRRARALLYGKGALVEASRLAAALLARDPQHQEAGAVAAEVRREYAARRRAVQALCDGGHYLRAKTDLEALTRGVEGDAEWQAEVAELAAVFAGEEGKAELALDRRFAALLKLLEDKKARGVDLRMVRALAKDKEGTRVGARILALADSLEAGAARR